MEKSSRRSFGSPPTNCGTFGTPFAQDDSLEALRFFKAGSKTIPTNTIFPYLCGNQSRPSGKRSRTASEQFIFCLFLLKGWSRKSDSNRRPADYESAALPTELLRLALLIVPLPPLPVKFGGEIFQPASVAQRRQTVRPTFRGGAKPRKSVVKRKEPPGNRAALSSGRIVPTEAKPSEHSGCIVGAGEASVNG